MKHKEMGHQNILTPRWFKDAKSFVKIATKCSKIIEVEGITLYQMIQAHSEDMIL